MRFYSKKGLFIGAILWGTIAFLIGAFFVLPGGPEGKGETVTAVKIVQFCFPSHYLKYT